MTTEEAPAIGVVFCFRIAEGGNAVLRKMFFFDFDETLYSHSAECIPRSASEALRALLARGHEVVIATGRGPESMRFIQRMVDLPLETIIMLNGQVIYQQGVKVFERFITLPSMRHIVSIARERSFAVGGYGVAGEIVDHVNERVEAVWRDFRCPVPKVQAPTEWSHALYQGQLYITQVEAIHVEEHLRDYVTNWSHDYLVNLISREAGKSQGIRWIMEKRGIPREHTYAFGDGFNDVDMLLSVGHGIAMGNATERLKDVAEHVTDRVTEDGVLHALQHYRIL